MLERARNTICDCVGAMIFGYDLPWSQMVVDYAMKYGPGGKSRILGKGGALVQPPMAALVNGSLAHAFELDGAAKPSSGAHPSATILPASLAVAQERGLGGKALITALVAATEVLLRIGAATKKSNEHRGFHAPGTTGPFAASVGAGKMIGLDAAKMVNAIGIAASLSGGLVQFSRAGTGGMVKRLHFGRAGESGVLAANLAERGFTGPHDILEGEFGFLRVFCDHYDMSKLTAGLGETFLTMNIYMKRYACHGSCQAPLQALQELQAKHKFSAADVEQIDIGGPPDTVDRHGIYEPKDPMIAQYSVPFAVALAFFRNPQDPRSFDMSAVVGSRNPGVVPPREAAPGIRLRCFRCHRQFEAQGWSGAAGRGNQNQGHACDPAGPGRRVPEILAADAALLEAEGGRDFRAASGDRKRKEFRLARGVI